jgi:hypothetical protein
MDKEKYDPFAPTPGIERGRDTNDPVYPHRGDVGRGGFADTDTEVTWPGPQGNEPSLPPAGDRDTPPRGRNG